MRKEGEPLFVGKKPFAEVFPEIETFEVEAAEFGPGGSVGRRNHGTVLAIACHNRRCHDGGFRVERVLWGMYAARETTRTEQVACRGAERSGSYRFSCSYYATMTITIRFKQA